MDLGTYVTLVGCWSVIGALILGWLVKIPTNNIAHTPCNTVGPYEAPTILLELNAMITLRGLNFSIEVK